nr:hypothetical protein [Fischerella sp. PCC 9605]
MAAVASSFDKPSVTDDDAPDVGTWGRGNAEIDLLRDYRELVLERSARSLYHCNGIVRLPAQDCGRGA